MELSYFKIPDEWHSGKAEADVCGVVAIRFGVKNFAHPTEPSSAKVLFGAMVEYQPIPAKYQSSFRQSGYDVGEKFLFKETNLNAVHTYMHISVVLCAYGRESFTDAHAPQWPRRKIQGML